MFEQPVISRDVSVLKSTIKGIREGKTNKEIAQAIFLSEKTVRNYVSSIFTKLDLSTRAQAAAYAVRHKVENHLPVD